MSIFDRAGTVKRLLNQYQDRPNLRAMFLVLLDSPSGELREALESLYGRLDIDGSSGVQLDRIGYIVGQPRPDSFSPLFLDTSDTTFSFLDGDNEPDKGFSGVDSPEIGGSFTGLQPSQLMQDHDYRLVLKAAIFRNNAGATIPEIERYGELVLGDVITLTNRFTSIDVHVPRRLSRQERAIIEQTLIPAAGIRINIKTFALGPRAFGFDGNTNNTGFASAFGDATVYAVQEVLLADGVNLLLQTSDKALALLPTETFFDPGMADGFAGLY